MNLRRVRLIIPLIILVVALISSVWASETEYPNHPIEIILNYAPGASLDNSMRIIQPALQGTLGVPLVLTTKAGAGGALGADFVAKAKPDGYTLGAFTFISITSAPQFNPAVAYRYTDFVAICTFSLDPVALVCKADAPWKTLEQLIDYAKKNRGKLSYGSPGVGGQGFLVMELLKMTYGLDIAHVPFQGAGPLKTAILGGHVDVAMGGFNAFISLVKAGNINALALTSPKRLADFPNIPTIAEKGFPEGSLCVWNGLCAPVKCPKVVADKLGRAMEKVMKDTAIISQIEKAGIIPEYRDNIATAKLLDDEFNAAGKVVKKVGTLK
jgi:tripartite-type tricarboxylate transporter receptor subunit TctC